MAAGFVVERPTALGPEVCDLAVAVASRLVLREGAVAHDDGGAAHIDRTVRRARQPAAPRSEEPAPLYDRVRQVAEECNRSAFGFELTGLAEDLVVVEYGPGDFYNWHLDSATPPPRPPLR